MIRRLLSLLFAILLLFSMTACSKSAVSSQERTAEARKNYYQHLDALLLTAAVCQIDPQSKGYALTTAQDGLQLSLEVNGVPATFSLQTKTVQTNVAANAPVPSIFGTSARYELNTGISLLSDYASHLTELGANVVFSLFKDMDGDGANEYIVIVEDFAQQWLSQMGVTQPVSLCLMADGDDSGHVVLHSVALPEQVTGVRDACWDNGMVHILYGSGYVYRVFAGDSATALTDYSGSTALLRKLCARYVTYIEDRGYTDIHIRLADISAAPGSEVICCYSDGTAYTTAVLTPYCGRLIPLYHFSGSSGALFVITQERLEYLLEYVQRLESDHSQSYSYRLFRFNEFHQLSADQEASIQIAADQGGGESGKTFFENVNAFLKSAEVCYDPYALTGYEVMAEQPEEEQILPETKYLQISNCSTNKTGTVRISDPNSWLNFRTGPSTAYDLILIDRTNPESFVKQTLGSPMTVIMPENTRDAENPIWVHIRISYGGRTLEGYSSQRYVAIEGIRHLSVGDSFTVTADTNDTGLLWSCSDTSVATIDGQTGMLTALRKGLVLIRVTSDSGLEDSCLVMID